MINLLQVFQGFFNIFLHKTPHLDIFELETFVNEQLKKRKIFTRAYELYGSPIYFIEQQVLLDRAKKFIKVFNDSFSEPQIFYAIKSNNHPIIIKTLLNAGLGLDVSSGTELELALNCGATNIVFSGPGKTDKELKLVIQNQKYITVLMDSYSELERLNNLALKARVSIIAGVRITTDERALWNKFGIPLNYLPDFFNKAEKYKNIHLKGIQFHTSWNLTPEKYVIFIKRLGRILKKVDKDNLERIQFIDIGGGYWPQQGEWLLFEGTLEGKFYNSLIHSTKRVISHYKFSAVPIEEFADQIAKALEKHVYPLIKCKIYTEPGRWLCNDAMHIIVRVIDKKREDMVITDAGTNAIGWERFETDYFPVINLSRPDIKEHKCYILGSLCTPHDIWGYSYHGKDIKIGDILLIPYQGAYTYSLRQEFIKPLPKVLYYTSNGEFKEYSNNNSNI
jgi:diaminopimelate decarboxylase